MTDPRKAGSRRIRRLVLPMVWLAATVCEGGPPPRGGFADDDSAGVTVRDSAGVEIVENHAPERPTGRFWTMGAEPEFVLGGDQGGDGAAHDSSHLVWEVTAAARLADGRVAVLSQGNRTILLFETSGKLSGSIGRGGRGPGEFSNPEHIQYLAGDTLVVWDAMLGPVSYFDASGALLKQKLIDLGAVFAAVRPFGGNTPERVMTPLADGSFVVAIGPRRDDSGRKGHWRYVRVDSTYSANALGEWYWGGGAAFAATFGFGERVTVLIPRYFVGRPHIAAGGPPPRVYISVADENEIHHFSAEGVLRRIIRRTTEPVPITAEERAVLAEEERRTYAPYPGLMAEVRRRREQLPPPRRFHPPINGLRMDTEGHLWVKDPLKNQWSVVGPDGRWLGTLSHTALGGRVLRIEEDLILTVHLDELGAERVEGHRLNRHPK